MSRLDAILMADGKYEIHQEEELLALLREQYNFPALSPEPSPSYFDTLLDLTLTKRSQFGNPNIFFGLLNHAISARPSLEDNYMHNFWSKYLENEFNYTEDDVKACARAFTGWNLAPTIPVFPYGRTPFEFRFDPADHDFGEKTFLGETGNWDGGDIVDIICKQPATARFVSRKLYDFFVADEPPVPSWRQSEPRDMDAIRQLEKAYFDSGYEITAMLTVLFNADFFKDEAVRFAKVKSPADVVIGTMRMVGDHLEPKPGLFFVAMEPKYMGFDLMNPPTVEGWHMGREWINSGSLIDRINFASSMLGNTELPGVKNIINRLMDIGDVPSSEQFLDGCLDLVGPMELAQETRSQLTEHLNAGGALKHGTDSEKGDFSRRAGETLQMIATTSEFQFG